MANPNFDTLWKNHPNTDNWFSSDFPCGSQFENQCAVRMGVSLEESGVNLRDFRGVRCWIRGLQPRHILRARELADWLSGPHSPFSRTLTFEKNARQSSVSLYDRARAGVQNRRGIIYFEDFWAPDGRSRTGDHIDLWDRYRATLWWTSFTYMTSDHFSESARIVFWEVQ